jgi:AcrR family transcriptional regulator
MGRPAGVRNAGYEERRRDFAQRAARALLRADGTAATFRDLSRSLEVSEPTLRHYFADYEGLVQAAFETVREGADHFASELEPLSKLPAREALRGYSTRLVMTFRRFQMGRLFAAALSLGLGHARFGPGFLENFLEPALGHAEALLKALREARQLSPGDDRARALSLVTPMVMALLHQDELGGQRARPLDVDAFVAQHLKTFLVGASPSRTRS